MKLTIKDDLLCESTRLEIYNRYNNNHMSQGPKWIDIKDLPEHFKGIVEFVGKEFDLSEAVGFELWTQYNTRPDWHYDKDEFIYNTANKMSYPICSIVYYSLIDDLQGGKLFTETIAIIPKTNRLVTFSPGVYHTVEEYTGQRFSVLLNPWKYRPKGL